MLRFVIITGSDILNKSIWKQVNMKKKYLFFVKQYKLVFWVLLVISVLRIIANIYMAEQHKGFVLANDGWDYRELAVSVASGKGFEIKTVRWFEAPREKAVPEAFRPLLLSAFGAGVLLFNSSSLIPLMLLQAVFFGILSFLVFLLTLKISDSTLAAWLALGLLQIHPLFNIYSLRFSTEILFTISLTLFCLSWLMKPGKYRCALIGITIGLAVWCRPTAALILPLAFLVCCVFEYKNKKNWLNPLLILLSFLLVVAPLSIRSKIHFDSWRFTSFFGGYNLWLGNNRHNLDAYQSSTGKEFLANQEIAWRQSIAWAKDLKKDLPPQAQEEFWKTKFYNEVREMGFFNWLKLLFLKAWHFIRPWPVTGIHGIFPFTIVTLYNLILLLLAAKGFWVLKNLRKLQPLIPLLIVFICGWSAHSLVHVIMRHRVPFMDMPLLVLAAIGLAHMLQKQYTKHPGDQV